MGLLERLLSRGVTRRGDDYVVRYEDDTGTHERVFPSRREAKNFRAALGIGKGESEPLRDVLDPRSVGFPSGSGD